MRNRSHSMSDNDGQTCACGISYVHIEGNAAINHAVFVMLVEAPICSWQRLEMEAMFHRDCFSSIELPCRQVQGLIEGRHGTCIEVNLCQDGALTPQCVLIGDAQGRYDELKRVVRILIVQLKAELQALKSNPSRAVRNVDFDKP